MPTKQAPSETLIRYFMSLDPIQDEMISSILLQSNPSNLIQMLNSFLGKENWAFEILTDSEINSPNTKLNKSYVEVAVYLPHIYRIGRARWDTDGLYLTESRINEAILNAVSYMRTGSIGYTQEQIAAMNNAKSVYQLDTDEKLLEALKNWNPNIQYKTQLLPEKVNEFIAYLDKEFSYMVQPQAPAQDTTAMLRPASEIQSPLPNDPAPVTVKENFSSNVVANNTPEELVI